MLRTPRIFFGAGKVSMIPVLLKPAGDHVLVLTGSRSWQSNAGIKALLGTLRGEGFSLSHEVVCGEPSPQMVDDIVGRYQNSKVCAVVSAGGGSTLDAGKAVSAMLPLGEPVHDYLEGVGTKNHPGAKKFFVAVPTTSGTGSEATSNAVISEKGSGGYKKSLRHDNLVPDVAVVDPELTAGCPPAITASCGLDAFTQLLESYVSLRATPMTDLLAMEGMVNCVGSLSRAVLDGSDSDARLRMSYAALLSGITLANGGLGLVHGFASAIGARYDIPHGVVCGTLMGVVNRFTVQRLEQEAPASTAFSKYAALGRMLTTAHPSLQRGPDDDRRLALQVPLYLEKLIDELRIGRLGDYGVRREDAVGLADATDQKSNPVHFSRDELAEMLRERI